MASESQAKTILLVDDDPVVHWVLEQYLTRAGYQTISASNGRQALDRLRQNTPGLIVLDVRMEDLDGLSALKEIKARPETRDIPVIIFTVNADELTRVKSESLGAAAFLTKPFSRTELIGHIERLLGPASLKDSTAS